MSANVSSLGRNSEWTERVGAPTPKSIIRDEWLALLITALVNYNQHCNYK